MIAYNLSVLRYLKIELLLHNCAIGLPYYIGVLTYEAEFDDIFYFFKDKFSLVFLVVILLSVVLACVSELSGNLLYI